MQSVELIKPSVESRHPLPPIQLGGHSPLSQCRHVQPRAAGLLVEVVGEADVAARHTHILHTRMPRYPPSGGSGSVVTTPSVATSSVQTDPSQYL